MSLEPATLDLDGDDFVTFPEVTVDGDTVRDNLTGEVLASVWPDIASASCTGSPVQLGCSRLGPVTKGA